MYNAGILITIGRLRNQKATNQEIINELCRLYSFSAKKAVEIIAYWDNIPEV